MHEILSKLLFVWKLSHSHVFFRSAYLSRGSRTKDHRARSPFFKLQAKYLSLELATSQLSRETGGISARNGLIQVTYS